MIKNNLDALFTPRSIAIVGASATPGKAGYMAVKLLETYTGKVYPVNPKTETILGYKVYPCLSAIGEPVDLVLFAVPASECPALMREAAAIKARAVIIMGGGFGESGEQGRQIQDELLSICQSHDIRMLGPNTGGFADPVNKLVASFSVSYAKLPPGPVAVVSQSGGISLILACMLENDGFGVSMTVGLGNSVDVEAADAIDYLVQDENTKVIALYLEGLSDGRRLFESIRRATQHKPVVALTIGRNAIGEFAKSHTGNLVGSYNLKTAAFKQAGAVVVDNSNDLVDAAGTLSHLRLQPVADPGIGVLIGQAGAGLLILDQLKSLGINVPELSEQGITRIAAQLPPMHYISNPVDAGRPTPEFKTVLQIMDEEEGLDAIVVFVLHEPTALDPVALFRELKPGMNKPVIYGTAGETRDMESTCRELVKLGVVPFTSPERAARAMRALADDARMQYRKTRYDTDTDVLPTEITLPPGKLDEAAGKQLLQQINIGVAEFVVCHNHEEAHAAFAKMNQAVAVKVLSTEILHKTEVGGVHLNIREHDQLDQALQQIDRIGDKGNYAYLLEAMAAPGLDLIVGGLRDPVFGPVVLLGIGGTIAEAIKDVSMRLAPLHRADAEEMLSELQAKTLLDGWRGAPPVDKQALVNALLSVSGLMMRCGEIQELDINPLRAYASGVQALDALIVRRA
jgi:acetyltransferase